MIKVNLITVLLSLYIDQPSIFISIHRYLLMKSRIAIKHDKIKKLHDETISRCNIAAFSDLFWQFDIVEILIVSPIIFYKAVKVLTLNVPYYMHRAR